MPTHASLALDRGGNLWVERFRPPWDEDTPRTFDLFAATGEWLGEVSVPDGFEIMEIGENYVLGVERDELGVEFVRVYGVEK